MDNGNYICLNYALYVNLVTLHFGMLGKLCIVYMSKIIGKCATPSSIRVHSATHCELRSVLSDSGIELYLYIPWQIGWCLAGGFTIRGAADTPGA